MSLSIGIDTGGTFTDLVAFDPATGAVSAVKTSSTPQAPGQAILDSLSEAGLPGAAIESFTHGTAIVDGVMLGIGLPGQVKEPIRWTLEGGRCVAIEGGEEAKRLREAIDGVENADVVGEFAFGTSEKAPFGTPSEKGRIGTVHLALGDNHNAYPGGQNVCSLHLDGVFLDATMWIVDDGAYILRDGEWVL